jgi:hypothetical protein
MSHEHLEQSARKQRKSLQHDLVRYPTYEARNLSMAISGKSQVLRGERAAKHGGNDFPKLHSVGLFRSD